KATLLPRAAPAPAFLPPEEAQALAGPCGRSAVRGTCQAENNQPRPGPPATLKRRIGLDLGRHISDNSRQIESFKQIAGDRFVRPGRIRSGGLFLQGRLEGAWDRQQSARGFFRRGWRYAMEPAALAVAPP